MLDVHRWKLCFNFYTNLEWTDWITKYCACYQQNNAGRCNLCWTNDIEFVGVNSFLIKWKTLIDSIKIIHLNDLHDGKISVFTSHEKCTIIFNFKTVSSKFPLADCCEKRNSSKGLSDSLTDPSILEKPTKSRRWDHFQSVIDQLPVTCIDHYTATARPIRLRVYLVVGQRVLVDNNFVKLPTFIFPSTSQYPTLSLSTYLLQNFTLK